MEEVKCKNCGAILEQTPGKRAREFCNVTCRSGYWQKKKRRPPSDVEVKEAAFKKSKKAGSKFKGVIPSIDAALDQSIQYDPQKSFDMPKAQVVADEHPKYFTPANSPVVDKFGATYPTDPQELIRMAKAGVVDVDAFKKHVSETKMTGGQRSMIYSKLK